MIELNNIEKKYNQKVLLKDYSVSIPQNELVCISGRSGAGKTTLLNILSLSEFPNSGDVIFNGKKNPDNKSIQLLRRKKIGYLFQNYGLVENETIKKNLDIIFKVCNVQGKNKQELYQQALEKVGLNKSYLNKKVYTLSGGEQQRIAVAKLIIKKPEFIFADEPTGNLDKENRDLVFKILLDFHQKGATVVYVSHDEQLIKKGNMNINLTSN